MRSFKDFLLEAAADSALINARGHVSELIVYNTINRYMEHRNNGLSHARALEKVGDEFEHVHEKSSAHPQYQKAQKSLGASGFKKVALDSHKASSSIIDHFHKTMGGITGSSTHLGPLSRKETEALHGGHYTSADVTVPTKEGIAGLGLKFSSKEEPGPEKLGTLGHNRIYDAIQTFHQAIHGSIDPKYHQASQQSENLNKLTPEEQKHHQEYKSAFVEKLDKQPSSSLSVLRALTNGRLKVPKAKSEQVKTDMEKGKKIRARARTELAEHRRRVLGNAISAMDKKNPAHVEAFHALVHSLMNSPHEYSPIQDYVVSISSGGNVSIQHHRQKATDAANAILKAGPTVSGSGATVKLSGGTHNIIAGISEKGTEVRLVKGKK